MIKIDKTQITLNKDARHKNTLNGFVSCLFDYARLASSFRVFLCLVYLTMLAWRLHPE